MHICIYLCTYTYICNCVTCVPISPKIILDEKVKFVTFIFLPLSTHLSKIFCVNMRSMQKVLAAY